MVGVQVGSLEQFSSLAYAPKHQNTIDWISDQIEEAADRLGSYGEAFITRARSVFNSTNSSEAIQRARAIVKMAGQVFLSDTVREMIDLSDIQCAMPDMQRWIMAHPPTRKLYHKNLLDGYSNSYVDMTPRDVGVDHYDWRLVMDGAATDYIDSNGEDNFYFSCYFEELVEGDQRLTAAKQSDIVSTWDVILSVLDNGVDDPTSIFGGKRN